MKIVIEFSGGAELLFGGLKRHELVLNQNDGCDTWTIRRLLTYMRDNMLRERPELFLDGEGIRPGILVLVNDSDWELAGELDYELEENDNIVFISTLHGG